MAYVGSHLGSMPAYALYHTPLHSTTESLKRSIVVSEAELPLEDGVSAIPRTFPICSELNTSTLAPEQHKREAIKTERTSKLDIHIGHHHLAPKDQSGPVPVQDQGQGMLALLTSLNKQTTSLLASSSSHSYSHLNPQNVSDRSDGIEDTSLLEQALVLGQIALVLASSLLTASAASASSNAECQAQVMVALANMGTVLIRRFDETGDGRELEEAGGLYQQGMAMGMGMRLGKTVTFGEKGGKGMGDGVGGGGEGGDGSDDGDGNGVDGVLGVLERLGRLLDERGGRALKGR